MFARQSDNEILEFKRDNRLFILDQERLVI